MVNTFVRQDLDILTDKLLTAFLFICKEANPIKSIDMYNINRIIAFY